MKIIDFSIDRVFIIITISYLIFTYVLNPYISYLINPNYPFNIKMKLLQL